VIIVGSRLRGAWILETVPNCELPNLLLAVGVQKTAMASVAREAED